MFQDWVKKPETKDKDKGKEKKGGKGKGKCKAKENGVQPKRAVASGVGLGA